MKKCTFKEIQDGGRRHLESRRAVAITLLSTNPHQIWWDCCESDKKRYCQFKNGKLFSKLPDGFRRHFVFHNCIAISLLLDQFLPNLV